MNISEPKCKQAGPGTPGANIEKNLSDRISRRFFSLDDNALCQRARQRTGLHDFCDPPVEKPLSTLTASLESEAALHPLGRFLMRMHLLGLLETRLRLVHNWQKRRETFSPVQRPVFITGMPRSGSTFLHELLALDPNNRSPRAWEVMFPLPAPDFRHVDDDPRIRKTAACLWWFRRFAPKADTVYPMRALTPHECVAIHSYTFLSEEFVSTCRIPTYEAFLRSEGMQSAYVWQKQFLQHLQSRWPDRQWILKSPDHLCSLEELFTVFPDAVILHTHRNPLDVLESSIQLTKILYGLYGRPGDDDQTQNDQARELAARMKRSLQFRDHHPELTDRFFDINYTEFIAHPIATIENIYRHLDRPLLPEVISKMRQLVSTRSRYRHPHFPTFTRLALETTAEVHQFRNYCQRFGIPCQPAAAEPRWAVPQILTPQG